jgi:DNA mismatch endonuclease Vsr
MQAVRSSGSKIETKLIKALWGKRYRFTKNDKRIFGKPDIVFRKLKIAIFVDSEFWHGKDWTLRKKEHKTNVEFWHNKIQRNIKRDKEVTRYLKNQNWKVIRIWGDDIKNRFDNILKKIEITINEERNKQKEI